jgi:hypothetical protein
MTAKVELADDTIIGVESYAFEDHGILRVETRPSGNGEGMPRLGQQTTYSAPWAWRTVIASNPSPRYTVSASTMSKLSLPSVALPPTE